MATYRKKIAQILICGITLFACSGGELFSNSNNSQNSQDSPVEINLSPAIPLSDISENEPVFISGTVPFTSPFFLNSASEPFVLLEDQAGFIARDLDFVFPLEGQVMGAVWQVDDETMEFSLSLPTVPQGTFVDVDQDEAEDTGLMVFAVAYWSNTWGGPFLEEREGTGWSGAYATTITDPENDYEINGGYLVIWSPDDLQEFPIGFGEDGLIFTEDDPVELVPAGYSIVDLNSPEFSIYKEAHPEFVLEEGSGVVKDYSGLDYDEAFDLMFEKVRLEYPFTAEKNIDWDELYVEFAPQVNKARTPADLYDVIRQLTYSIPDAHVGISFNDYANQAFYDEGAGSFGLVLAELSDGRVIVTKVLPDTTGDDAGILPGAEIVKWDGMPVLEALRAVYPFFGPYSTQHHLEIDQAIFLTRYPPFTQIEVSFINPNKSLKTVDLDAEVEYESLFEALGYNDGDEIALPIESYTLDNGIAYIQIHTFSDDYNLMAQIWHYQINAMIEADVPGIIIDMRVNGGGSGGMAADMVGYFIDEEIEVSQHAYYNHTLGEFEYGDHSSVLDPAPLYYDGPIAVLISPSCVSACEGFTYWLTLRDNTTVIGHAGTAGAYGEVGRGQYSLPGDIDLQFPTGRPETIDGDLLIEGTGILPDIYVPVTFESAMGQNDVLIENAIEILLP
jgi:C-terminal processing protease CtpA/Prc